MKNILCTGFKGKLNSSNILLDNIIKNNKIDYLYLENEFIESENQLIEKIKGNKYDFIFSFGQKPVLKSIYIEKIGTNKKNKMETNYNIVGLKCFLEKYYKIKISENAGKYLCNNIYYKGLNYINENKLKAKMVFIHIPKINNMDIKYFSKIINEYFEEIIKE
jgi:pyroglutamyl-peptidase